MRGDCQREFQQAAAGDGIELVGQSVDWLTQRGHLALPPEAAPTAEVLERIYTALGGDLDELAAARPTRLTGDFVHATTGTLIEVDESQHFTTARLTTLELYPSDAPLGYDLEHYKRRCRRLREQADRYFAAKSARGFGVGGRQRQRAYYDALRDLATPAMGYPPLVRVAAPDRNGRGAYRAHRDRLLPLSAASGTRYNDAGNDS